MNEHGFGMHLHHDDRQGDELRVEPQAWTAPRTWVTSELVTSSIMNTHVRDDLKEVWWEVAYDEDTQSAVTFTATTAGSANALPLISGSVTYAALPTLVEVFCPQLSRGTSSATLVLYDGTTQLGNLGGTVSTVAFSAKARFTPTAASHDYNVRAFVDGGTGQIASGNGAAGSLWPSFIRVSQRGG